MIIDKQLSHIEKNFREKKIQEAFQLISSLKDKYPKNYRLDNFFKNNKQKYIKKMKIDFNQIQELYKKENLNDIKIYVDTLLKHDPSNAYINSFLGEFHGIQKNFLKAQTYQEKAILSNPYEVIFYINLASTYKFLGKLSLSKLFLEYALVMDEKHEVALINYARILFTFKNYSKVFLIFEKLISQISNPNNLKYKIEFFERLIDLEKVNEAKKILSQIKIEKTSEDFIKVLYLQGILKKTQRNLNEAKIIFEQCLEIDKNFFNASIALASIYKIENNFIECKNLLNNVINIDNENAKAIFELGIIYSHLGEIKKGITLLKKSLEIEPFNNEIKFNLGQMQIYNKDFKEGWINFKSRWHYYNFKSLPFKSSKKRLIHLDQSNNVLIWNEQGIGDQIMYGSMFSEMSKISKKVLVKFDKRLIKIFENKHPDIHFINDETTISENDYDTHISLGDLGSLLRKDLNSFKNIKFPYIDFDKKICNAIRNTYKSKNKILAGISWTSKNEEVGQDKSINLMNLIPILKLKDFMFLDLEYKDSEFDKNALYKETNIKIYKNKNIDYLNDILAVSSIINSCDLIITCSNVNAHIAGALGKKTYLLLPLGKGRLLNWGHDNKKSIWYPSVKIFQQKISGDWTYPLKKLEEEILSFSHN